MAKDDAPEATPSSRLNAQIELVVGRGERSTGDDDHLPDAAAHPATWRDDGQVDYLHHRTWILARDDDADAVQGIVGGGRVTHDRNVRGLSRIEVPEGDASVDDLCQQVDEQLGEGIATPDHVMYVCPTSTCPATEPEEVHRSQGLVPQLSTDECDGRGVLVSVLDSGWVAGSGEQHAWLQGVGGEPDAEVDEAAGTIGAYGGHGTFVAGIVRAMAPRAEVDVRCTFVKAGAVYESDLVADVARALRRGSSVIVLAFGTNTRKDIPSLGFDVIGRMLAQHKGVVLVAAAGNDGSRRPFWPAAFPWAVSVGALDASWQDRAWFSNHGPWVDVYAPGEGLVNAFPAGRYVCTEPPNTGVVRTFDGLARWSGTSFSTPLVAGLIAARMSQTGENGPQAAAALLGHARGGTIPGVGPVLRPGDACGGRHHPPEGPGHHGHPGHRGHHGGGCGCC
jgi:hypothetical protein